MKALTVAQLKARFSEVLARVEHGENIKVLYGRSKRPVAMIVPIEGAGSPRRIGVLDGRATFKINGDGKISEEEFLGMGL